MEKQIDDLMKIAYQKDEKKNLWKDKYFTKNDELLETVNRFEKDMAMYWTRDIQKVNNSCQTDIDLTLFKEYHASYDTLSNSRRLVSNQSLLT